MKRAILPALGLALLLSYPAVPQDAGKKTLEEQVVELTEVVTKQDARLKELEAYAAAQKAEAANLSGYLTKAEKKGFYFPAPHNDAKKALIKGLSRFATVAGGGKLEPDEE